MTRLRVLTVNVQNDEGDPRRTAVLNRGLLELEPDLVAMQEVIRTPERDQLEELLAGSGLTGTHQADVIGYEPPWADRYGGSAVATRRPHELIEVLDLRGPDAADMPWCTLAASIDVPGEGDLLFIAATATAAAKRRRTSTAGIEAGGPVCRCISSTVRRAQGRR